MIEAAPVIEYFRLKKDMDIHEFSVYRNSDIALIVSGVGKIKSAVASAYLYSIYGLDSDNIMLNIGFCGAGSPRYSPGTLILMNKITDMDTGKDYYPDVFYGKNLPKESLCCFSRPVGRNDTMKNDDSFFCDMESAGFMEAAKKFVYAHNIAVLKIISDYLEPEKLDKELLKGYVKNQIPLVEGIINQMHTINESYSEFSLSEEEMKIIGLLSRDLKFSEAMKQVLFKEVKRAKIRGLETLKILGPFTEARADSKAEGKKILEEIKQRMNQGYV